MAHLTAEAGQAILNEYFARWVLATGIACRATGAETATLEMPFSADLCRVGGIICGQALATGADTAMVIAIAAASGAFRPCTSVDLTINFMRPVSDAAAVFEARVVRLGKTLSFCTTEIKDATSGRIAAFSTGTYAMLA